MDFDSYYRPVGVPGLKHYAKGFFYTLFVILTPWWGEFQESRRIRRRFLAKMQVSEQEFTDVRQLMRRKVY